jgi:hypothetical protein
LSLDGSAIAIDIETVSPEVKDPNLQNPDHVELLCIGVGHQACPESPVETHVLFRRDRTPEAEIELLYRLYEWVRTHISEYLLTYNGTKFDLLHLRGRADRAQRASDAPVEAREWIDIILDIHVHRDLFLECIDRYDEWLKLEELCNKLGVPTSETECEEDTVENDTIPELGESFLNGDDSVLKSLIDYTEADIEPLFGLAAEM